MDEIFLDDNVNYDHLLPQARQLVELPSGERITRIRSERWIGYARAQDAIARLELLFHHPQKTRMPNLLIVGPTNNGKSMIVERFRRMHPQIHRENEVISEIPLLVV